MRPPLVEPLVFGAATCFGWLHRAPEGVQGLPVLICGPVGAEDLSAHRLLRVAAEALAAQGQTCLRFDLAGVGDSAPLAADEDAVPAWLASVQDAIEALRAATGAPRVALLGLRLGATLGAWVAQGRDDVAALAAIVPVLSGRALLREWKMLGAAGLPSLSHPDGSLETGGFLFNAATCAALGRLRLDQPWVRPADRVLVIDRDDLPVAAAWCEALTALGTAVAHHRLPGFDGLMAAPHLTVLPEAMLQAALGWLRALPAEPVSQNLTHPALAVHALGRGGGVREAARCLPAGSADEPALWLQCTDPAREQAVNGDAVLVLNTGAERRIGPHGQFVPLARRWAAAGVRVWRLDLAGLGDSPAPAGAESQRVYPATALADIGRAVSALRAEPGVQRVVLLGLCSGAFHAFEAAAAGLGVDQAVIINPLVFFRPVDENFDAVPAQDHAVQQLSGEALRHLRDPARWFKLLRGEVNWRFILATLRRRVQLAGKRGRRALARAAGRPWPDDLAAKLRRAAQHTHLSFVFAQNDPGLALLQAEAGRHWRALLRGPQVNLHSVPGADHTFSRAAHRAQLQAVLDAVLGLPSPVVRADAPTRRALMPAATQERWAA